MKRYCFSTAAVLALTICCFVAAKAQSAPPQTEEDKVYQQSEVDKKPEILNRPKPPNDGRCGRGPGTAFFRVILHKSGKVTSAEMIQSSSCEYFDARGREAAMSIKFNPGIKDGQPVSVTMIISFKFWIQ